MIFLVALIATLGSDVLIAGEPATVKPSISNGSEKRSDSGSSEPLPEFAYRNVRIGLRTLKGKPVSGARVYGYCPSFHLI